MLLGFVLLCWLLFFLCECLCIPSSDTANSATRVYVGVPNFANKYINDYQYNYNHLSITNPTPNSFHVHQKQNLDASGFSGSGHLSAFNATIRASGSDIPFAVFPVQEIEFGGDSDFTIDQDLNIACVDCLSRLAADAVREKEISVLVTGKPDLKVGGLPTAHLDVHKTMAMKGYNVEGGTYMCFPILDGSR